MTFVSQVERSVKEVRDLGTNAQSDLGLDYSWLDDVTVHDWAVRFTNGDAVYPLLIS